MPLCRVGGVADTREQIPLPSKMLARLAEAGSHWADTPTRSYAGCSAEGG